MELCLDTKRRPVLRVPKWWWDQEFLVLPVIQASGEENDGYRVISED